MRGILACSFALVATSTAAAALVATPAQTVAAVVLRPAQVAPNVTLKRLPGGNQVAGQVTLDLCGYTFHTEALRVARLQVAYARGATPVVSNEVVAYKPGGAASALHELRTAIANCPAGYVTSKVRGIGQLENSITRVSAPGTLPGTVAILDRITQKLNGKTTQFDAVLVFQARRDVLSAVYGYGRAELPLVRHAAAQSALNLKRL
ncbi:MAG TPA: hypothetical protein VNH45_03710 [Gaiellaceae bacterium]|nr:hypothetical protein [Gaiellaceae bacterium]